eukprot:1150811-Pelagomonas_calceolata.AAC.4
MQQATAATKQKYGCDAANGQCGRQRGQSLLTAWVKPPSCPFTQDGCPSFVEWFQNGNISSPASSWAQRRVLQAALLVSCAT